MSGIEWVIDAHGCSPEALSSSALLDELFQRIISAMHLRPVGSTQWHRFPNTGGITGLCLLAESHLACHTFPEFGSLCLNIFCCVPREAWDFEIALKAMFGATSVSMRSITRSYGAEDGTNLAGSREILPVVNLG
ncbi:MAG TPA: S-adenosylmethionine decarboxylase [Candidatus Sulfotelmatobacter sp.]|nr:S-adenosylmethionine decarboxylase [Candidatus Sulfotelmatobacter sp.]